MPNSSTRSTDAAHPEPACPEQSRRVEGRALVLFSGGQDSTTCLFWAKHPDFGGFDRVEAVGFRYGQKHAVELEQAGQIAEIAGVPFTVLDLDGLLSGSALTEHDKDVSGPHERAPDLPASFVPGRNALFLSVAASFGYTRGITDLVGGMCQTDYSGYPDCRPEYVRAFEDMANLATKRGVEGHRLRIRTPLIDWTKAEIIRRGAELGVDFALTLSCYQPDDAGRACGACDACRLRAKGFADAGVPDPTGYR
jgi:7-cyano-7-deazaguanine synthase